MSVPYSGRQGFVSGFTSIEEWSIDYKAPEVAVATSGTKYAEIQLPGPKDWSGGFKTPNQLAVCVPSATASIGCSLDGSVGFTGPVIFDSLDLGWDIEGGKPITQDIKFSANGPLTYGACVVTESAIPTPYTSLGTKGTLQLATGGGYIQLQGVKSMTMRFNAKNSEYKDSDTNGWTYRLPGNVSCSLSWNINVSDVSQLISLCSPNLFCQARLYVDGSVYWAINYVKFTGISGIQSNRASGAVVGATLNAVFTSHWNGNLGSIIGPTAVQLWPLA